MANLIDDGHLVGYWPLNEPSGAPYFHNYSNTYGGKPSGISFDMHVHIADNANDGGLSEWPGTTSMFNQESGVTYQGFLMQSDYQQGLLNFEHCKVLGVGMGDQPTKTATTFPRIAQSGFTLGAWIMPTTDGLIGYPVTGGNGKFEQARGNAAIYRGDDDDVICMGVSGMLTGGAQFESTEFGGPHRLTAFAYITEAKGTNPDTSNGALALETPVESGRYTHVAISYRYLGGSNNEFVLYKDGRVASSGITSADVDSANFTTSAFWTIGGTSDGNNINSFDYLGATGWNKMISGVYYFNRVLHEGEVLEMHDCGGLQADDGTQPKPATPVSLSDPKLLAYYPFNSAFEDVSANKQPLIAPFDPGQTDFLIAAPGPYGKGGIMKTGNSPVETVCSSGVTNGLVDNVSFTIAGFFVLPDFTSIEYLRGMMCSLGSVRERQDLLSLSNSTACFMMTIDDATGTNKEVFAIFHPDGTANGNTVTLKAPTYEMGDRFGTHFAIAYDDQTNGVALYMHGEMQASGTVSGNFRNQIDGVIGSGFPLCIAGGIEDQDIYSGWAFTTNNPAGLNLETHNVAVFGRPLLESEINYLARNSMDISDLDRGVHDSRLMGFWPATDFEYGDSHVEDRAQNWRSFAGNLAFGLPEGMWVEIESTDTEGPWYTFDPFGNRSDLPELASFGNLGMTSGIFISQGGSPGARVNSQSLNSRNSASDWAARYQLVEEDNDVETHHMNRGLWYFEVTPSGAIPDAVNDGSNTEFNSLVLNFGNSIDNLRFYLTSVNSDSADALGTDAGTGPSGVSLVVATNAGSTDTMVASGNVNFGVPNNVLFSYEYAHPFANNLSAADDLFVKLYINGEKVYQSTVIQNVANLWTDDSPLSFDGCLSVGGIVAGSTAANQISTDNAGLGEIYMRNIAFMRGVFSEDDIAYFAASGINIDSPLPGYIAQDVSTQVTIADSNLQGYWRFSGGESGELDLTVNANNLSLLGKEILEGGGFSSSNIEGLNNFRFMPGPLIGSDLGVRCSGITYGGDTPVTNTTSFFAGSGIGHDPTSSFSIGFRLAARQETNSSSNDADVILAYGVIPATATNSSTDPNYGWTVSIDAAEGIKFVGSTTGNMYMNNVANSAQAGQVEVGAQFSTSAKPDNTFEVFRQGSLGPPHVDAYNHYCYTVDYENSRIRCFMNGVLVHDRHLPSEGLQDPADPTARLLTFFNHQVDEPWNFASNLQNDEALLTDLFLFDRALTEAEVRYITFNGIDAATGSAISGVTGGYLRGQDTASGIVGGYSRGQDNMSGVIGGYIPGGIIASGLMGGYVSGIIFGTGTLGGFVQGLDTVSGIAAGYIVGVEIGSGMLAGYIRGSEVGSGIFGGLILAGQAASGAMGGLMFASDQASGILGGYMLGGLQGNFEFDANFTVEAIAAENFDAQLEIAKTAASDFDAKLIIFQDEATPLVDIIVPDSTVTGLVPPFNQYFVGVASGQQGKTISQTRWNFGDFSPIVTVAESGVGMYPVQHNFASSGFYVVRFEAIDSDGVHATATRIVNAASGIDPVIVSLSGVPRSGPAGLTVDFSTSIDILPPGVSVVARLLNFDDGQTTIAFNPTHVYTEPGVYKPIWTVRDSRGIIWCDSLEAGNDFLTNGGL